MTNTDILRFSHQAEALSKEIKKYTHRGDTAPVSTDNLRLLIIAIDHLLIASAVLDAASHE